MASSRKSEEQERYASRRDVKQLAQSSPDGLGSSAEAGTASCNRTRRDLLGLGIQALGRCAASSCVVQGSHKTIKALVSFCPPARWIPSLVALLVAEVFWDWGSWKREGKVLIKVKGLKQESYKLSLSIFRGKIWERLLMIRDSGRDFQKQ